MFRWIFFDVGNVLIDEDPLTLLSFRRHVESVVRVRSDLSFLDLLSQREARAAAGSRWPVFEVVSAVLDGPRCAEVWEETAREVRNRFAELGPPIPGAVELVERMSRRHRLGLIANQGRECRARLAELGILGRFEVVALGEELGACKPEQALFRHALRAAGAEPGECLMVGDRLDNDIAPASALGMATAWVRWPRRAAKGDGWTVGDPEARAYLDSLERTAALSPSLWPDVRPDLVIDEVCDLDAALLDAAS
jgi:HAD superfamily hydrolase (TIGR01509 family)